MTFTTSELDNFALTLPITQAARNTAQEFAHQQPTLEKVEQVLLNTLSVWVVNDYLEFMGIPANKRTSDSWNPILRLCANVADLDLPGMGRLECRPLSLQQQMCYIPPETWEERIGYVIVQVNESLQEAKLLGFVRNVVTEELPLSQLQPLPNLIEHLGQLKQTKVNLRSWFAGVFEAGWLTLEALKNELQLKSAYTFRRGDSVQDRPDSSPVGDATRSLRNRRDTASQSPGSENPSLNYSLTHQKRAFIKRAKLIDLGIQIANQPVILIVEVRLEADQKTSICLQLHPPKHKIYLVPGVQMKVLDESGAVFLESLARRADNYIQLQFKGEPEEQFSVKIALHDVSITEHFII